MSNKIQFVWRFLDELTLCVIFERQKTERMKSKIEKLSTDILAQIAYQFGENYKIVIGILETELSESDILNSSRIIRCIIYLSENSIEKLRENINSAKIDWRDIILWAEYENDEKNEPKLKRDFNKPFIN